MADKDEKKVTPDASAPAPKVMPEIEIEFGDDRNRVFAWGPTMEILRGAWSRRNLHSDELVEDLAAMPDIPGIRIRMSYERKLAVIYDPLALESNKDVCEKIARIIFDRFRRREGPAKPVERRNMDVDDLKTWLYGMRRRLDSNSARLIVGDLPSLDQIANLPGRTRIEMYNSSSRACKWKEEFDRYTDAIISGRAQPTMV